MSFLPAAQHRRASAIPAPRISTPASPRPALRRPTFLDFVAGKPVGAVVVGGSAAANPCRTGQPGRQQSWAAICTSRAISIPTRIISTLTKGRHAFSAGAWFQPLQSNEDLALTQFGQATFTGLQQFLQGTVGTFLYDPAPTEMNWRSLLGAWYSQDAFRVTPKLTLSLGFRDEFTTGWNEAHGRAANFVFTNGVIQTQPRIASSAFTANHASFLPQPRIGLAWSPSGSKTVLRAGFGMYNDLQDALGYRMDQNAPFNPSYGIANLPVSEPPASFVACPGQCQGRPRGSSARHAYSDADLLFARIRAGIIAEHRPHHRICRLTRLPPNRQPRRQRTHPHHLSRVPMPGDISRHFPISAGGRCNPCGRLLHSSRNACG